MTLTIGSMFSGYGGLDMGVCQVLDAETAWFCEWDDAPSKILAHHWPDVPNYRDVTTVDWSAVPPVDIITGGYPCQPFSKAGQRKGTHDDRHLWPHVREAIRHLRPRFALLENVAGHRSLGFDRVLGDLAEDGCNVRWTTLRASDVGAPHHRERLFILVIPPDSDRVGLEAERCAGRPAPTIPGDYDGHSALAWAGGTTDIMRDAHQRWGDSAPAILAWALIHGEPPLPTRDTVRYHDEDLWGRRFPEPKPELDPAWPEWMMGLPQGWVTSVPGVTRAQQLKAIGNGVVPQQAAAALRHLLGDQ